MAFQEPIQVMAGAHRRPAPADTGGSWTVIKFSHTRRDHQQQTCGTLQARRQAKLCVRLDSIQHRTGINDVSCWCDRKAVAKEAAERCALAESRIPDDASCLAFAQSAPKSTRAQTHIGLHFGSQLAAAQAWPHYEHIEQAYTLLCAMAREQTRGTQHQHSIALMIAKQASTLAQKLLLLVSHSTTDSATTPPFAILPGKAPELISIMESLLPWTLRLTLLRLVCALSCQHKLQLLLHHGSRGLSCLHEWLLAANDITDMAKREALQLALLQTLAILGHAHRRLVQPWMLLAASKLARSSPLHSVRLAAVKFKRLSEMQAASQAPGEGSSTDNKRLTYKLQPEAANHFPPTGPQTALRSPQADIAAVPPSHNALDTPCNSPQLGDGPAQVTDSSITAAAEAGAVAGIGSSAAAAAVAKVRKVVGASSGTTTSDIAVAAPAAPRFAALLTAANLAAGEMAVGSQTPLPLHLRSDTPTQGMYTKEALQRARVAIQQAGATQQGDRTVQQGGGTTQQGGVVVQQRGVIIQKGDGAIQLGSVTVQQAGTRRRLFADTDAAVMPPAKLQRLSTVTVAQVSSKYWQSVINVRQGHLKGEQQQQQQQQQGVQLVQSDVAAGFWQLAEAAFRPIGSGGICLGAVEYMEQMLEDSTLQACALKRLRYTTPAEQTAAKLETAALFAMRGGAHLAQLVQAGCYQEPATKQWQWALVMRFVPGNTMAAVYGELWQHIRQPQGASTIRHVTQRVFPHICQAVKALHDRRISHTDLKPGNIIISKAEAGLVGLKATVIDLGGAIFNNEWPAEMGIHHTAEYSSPELLYKLRLRKTTLNIDMCANDVWSLGCLLALALTGHKLFGYSSHQGTPPAYQHRLDQACSSQRPWVESFHEGFPELCMADDAAVDSIPYTNHVYKRLAQTIPDHDHRRPMFELLKAMLHPDPQLRASMGHVLASSVFHSC